jgi:PAS domain S-box-containing protein
LRRAALLAIIAVTLGMPAAARARAGEPRRVLILNSYHPGYQWTDDETRGVLAALGGSPRDIQVYIEYMGTKWASAPTYFQQLREAYATKFQKLRFDVIVATDDDALRFLLQYREAVFGRIPTVFCGVNDFDPARLRDRPLYTGVNEVVDFRGGLDLALRLHPATRRIAVISDSSISGRKVRAQFERVVPGYADRIAFEFLGDGPVEAVLDRVARLPADSLVFHLVYFSDTNGKIINNDETAALVSRASHVPVYGAWEFSLGHGIVGGKLLAGHDQGVLAGGMARRVLEGIRIEDIPVVMTSPSRFMFDDEQLRRFGIRQSELPAGSAVINAPPSFYALNKALVWGGVGGLAGLSGVVLLLLVSRARRRRAEEALRHSEARYRAIVDGFDGLIYVCSAGRRLEFVNARLAARLCGEPGGPCHQALYGESAPCAWCRLESVIRGNVARRELRDPVDGRWYHVVDVPIEHPHGARSQQTLALDITDRKRAEEALRASEEKFRTLVENLRIGVYRCTASAPVRFLQVNPAMERIFGRPAQPLAEFPVTDMFVDPRDQVALLDDVRRHGFVRDREIALRGGDGTVRTVAVTATAAGRDERGGLLWIDGTAEDVTDRRELDRRLALADRMASVGTLAAGVAHEINNPLSYILSNLRFLSGELGKLEAKDPERLEEARKVTHEALEGAERVRRIVLDLHTFARPDDKQGPVDVHRVLDLAINIASNQIRVRARIVKDYGQVPLVQGDESRLGQVAINLLVNAAQAIPEGQPDENEIRVVTRADSAGRTLIEVRDTGCGIPPEIRSHVFEPFFTTKPVGTGTGLGLSICHGIVTALGGEITLESDPGKGSVFRVALPPAAPE